MHYTPNMGILPLREAVAEHIKRQTGVSYDPKTYAVTVNVEDDGKGQLVASTEARVRSCSTTPTPPLPQP